MNVISEWFVDYGKARSIGIYANHNLLRNRQALHGNKKIDSLIFSSLFID